MYKKYFLFFCLVFQLLGFSWPSYQINYSPLPGNKLSELSWINKNSKIFHSEGLSDSVLRLSLTAYQHAEQKGMTSKKLLTVIDYSKPATEKRLWVLDLANGKVLFNTWVSHGKNSGGVSSNSFSNLAGSLKSSIGVFLTDQPYLGGNGYSLRLRGLENGINNHAYDRMIVVHGARYVNPDIIKKYGKIGRSWGCPAVSPTLSKPLINTIKDKTVVVAYYPDRNWLSHSQFLVS